ncbi:hypothetical protein HQ571_06615 [Candidatus Kuenenbacteria bacterium]|nr:hypothetical protein [Candidatus Kuenenbacteria bacterium]
MKQRIYIMKIGSSWDNMTSQMDMVEIQFKVSPGPTQLTDEQIDNQAQMIAQGLFEGFNLSPQKYKITSLFEMIEEKTRTLKGGIVRLIRKTRAVK